METTIGFIHTPVTNRLATFVTECARTPFIGLVTGASGTGIIFSLAEEAPGGSVACRCHEQTGYVAALAELAESAGCHLNIRKFPKGLATKTLAEIFVRRQTPLIILDHVEGWAKEALEVIPNLFTGIRSKGGATGLLLTSHVEPQHWLPQNFRLAAKVRSHILPFNELTEWEVWGILNTLQKRLPKTDGHLPIDNGALRQAARSMMEKTEGNWDRIREELAADGFWNPAVVLAPAASGVSSLANGDQNQPRPAHPGASYSEHMDFALIGD